MVQVRDRAHVGARQQQLAMELELRHRAPVGGALVHLEQLVAVERRAIGVERLDEERVLTQPRAHMPAVAEHAEHRQHARGERELVPHASAIDSRTSRSISDQTWSTILPNSGVRLVSRVRGRGMSIVTIDFTCPGRGVRIRIRSDR